MIAALQMYDWPEVRSETDAFWALASETLRGYGIGSTGLSRGDDLAAAWRDPALLLAQTCGLPLVRGACGEAVPFARPHYQVEGCGIGTYRSAIVVRADEPGDLAAFRGRRAVINGWDSQSGCNALLDVVRIDVVGAKMSTGEPFFQDALVSGTHRASADLVAGGGADVCALDAVSWSLYKLAEPQRARSLRVLTWSAEAPSLPYITAPANARHAAHLCEALDLAASDSPACPAIPVRVMLAELADYGPIIEMSERVKGVTLAPQVASHI